MGELYHETLSRRGKNRRPFLILVPDRAEALGRALGETHRRYSAVVNPRLRVTGHLFQSR
jgi:hypothetical protein